MSTIFDDIVHIAKAQSDAYSDAYAEGRRVGYNVGFSDAMRKAATMVDKAFEVPAKISVKPVSTENLEQLAAKYKP